MEDFYVKIHICECLIWWNSNSVFSHYDSKKWKIFDCKQTKIKILRWKAHRFYWNPADFVCDFPPILTEISMSVRSCLVCRRSGWDWATHLPVLDLAPRFVTPCFGLIVCFWKNKKIWDRKMNWSGLIFALSENDEVDVSVSWMKAPIFSSVMAQGSRWTLSDAPYTARCHVPRWPAANRKTHGPLFWQWV